MSDGTPNPATWPMWRGPFAYGHATATRIFCGTSDMDAHDTSGLHPNPSSQWDAPRRADESRGEQERRGGEREDETTRPPLIDFACRRTARGPRPRHGSARHFVTRQLPSNRPSG